MEKEVIIKLLILLINIYGTLAEKKTESVIGMIMDAFWDGFEELYTKRRKLDKTVKKEFAEVIKKAAHEMTEKIDDQSMKDIWKQKEGKIVYELNNIKWEEVKIDDCKNIIRDIFTKRDLFEPLEYTQKSYEKGAEEFFKFWIDSLVKQPMASTQIIIQSILGIYSKIALLEQDSSDMNISPELISLQTKRPKNTFNEQSRKTEINNLTKTSHTNKVC